MSDPALAHLLPDPLRRGISRQVVVAALPGLETVFRELTQYPGRRWIFRGQPDTKASLQPSIERLVLAEGTTKYSAERFVRREFKRRAHHYLTQLPDRRDELACFDAPPWSAFKAVGLDAFATRGGTLRRECCGSWERFHGVGGRSVRAYSVVPERNYRKGLRAR
jgi:hypothetical protein